MSEGLLAFDEVKRIVHCSGRWTLNTAAHLLEQSKKLDGLSAISIIVDASAIDEIDSAGSLLLHRLLERLRAKKVHIENVLTTQKTDQLLKLIATTVPSCSDEPMAKAESSSWLVDIGKAAYTKGNECVSFLSMLGEITLRFRHALFHWREFHIDSVVGVIENAGLRALGIVGLLSFLIGVVLAYQMGLQLKTYGANIYIAQLSGMALQREFSPLITAIIVAGRTSSAFTAQLGSMKVGEELDALMTMGIAPTELLILPKVMGLLLVFPLLVFWSDLFATLGAMAMAKGMLGVGYIEFLQQLKETLGIRQYWIGLSKAPAFSLLIALVGCFQGLQVQGSANSVGSYTTKSVVQAIFLIIVADAAFSIAFSWLGI